MTRDSILVRVINFTGLQRCEPVIIQLILSPIIDEKLFLRHVGRMLGLIQHGH